MEKVNYMILSVWIPKFLQKRKETKYFKEVMNQIRHQ